MKGSTRNMCGAVTIPVRAWFDAAEFGTFRDTLEVHITILPVFDIELTEVYATAGRDTSLSLRDYLSQENYVGL